MKKLFSILCCCCCYLFLNVAVAQKSFGLVVYGNYNLYSWHQEGSHSTGQAMNVLGGAGIGFWAMPTNGFKISLEAGAEFLPFSFDITNYKGMGTVNFPGLVRFAFIDGVRGLFFPLSMALGVELSKTELYAQPVPEPDPSWRLAYIGELSLGIGGYLDNSFFDSQSLNLFIRMGGNPHHKLLSLSVGLRFTFET